MFDTLDEHDDGEIARDEFLASLDLDHPHLMAFLKASPATTATAGAGGGVGNGAEVGRRCGRNAVGVETAVGPVTVSTFDAVEANDDEFIAWEEARGMTLALPFL